MLKTVNRRTAAAAVAATLLPFGSVRAQSPAFPSRTISVVVGFPAGGATDVTARVMQPHLQKSWGQTIIVENVPGAGGSIGVQKMLNAAPVWQGLFGPAALPAEAATKVNAAVNDAIRTPEYVKFSAENGTRVPDPGLTLQQAAKFYADDTEKLRRLARSIKLEAT
jgi:tripartite-type tricarboxylate transporter receptor subunit TctC